MVEEANIYDSLSAGELGDSLEHLAISASLLAMAFRKIIDELPFDLDAAKLATMALPVAYAAERQADRLLERLKNGGLR